MSYMLLFLSLFLRLQGTEAKIVALVAGRNESIMIEQCFRALAMYADAIVYLDDASDDNSVEIVQALAQSCRVEKIIRKEVWFRDEPRDRNQMLQAGREIGGTHFIVIDADELFTANCAKNGWLRSEILSLKPGDKLLFNWIQLWRSPYKYRYDSSVWTNNYKGFVFCDDGRCCYRSDFIHTSRLPGDLNGHAYVIEGYEKGLMHCQFINWRNMLVKQAWYRCLEHIRLPLKPVEVINALYAPSKDETGLCTVDCPTEWFEGYVFFDPSIFEKSECWRERQIIGWFAHYSKAYFEDLDIWDIDWNYSAAVQPHRERRMNRLILKKNPRLKHRKMAVLGIRSPAFGRCLQMH